MKRLLALLLLLACGDNGKPVNGVTACLERPTDLPRAPDAGLSCDLIPPR